MSIEVDTAIKDLIAAGQFAEMASDAKAIATLDLAIKALKGLQIEKLAGPTTGAGLN